MFIFSSNTKISYERQTKPVKHAVRMLERDMCSVFRVSENPVNYIHLEEVICEQEQFTLTAADNTMTVNAGDDLGFVYGLLYISEHYLNIKPFWFWMDMEPEKCRSIEIKDMVFTSVKPVVRFRGWFFNDEVLMLKWKLNQEGKEGWKMAFEALLRCGGNMAIPGTDKMSRENRALASEMGLMITHHHAEPLGAEMFARAYPDKEANFLENSHLFYKLWEDAVLEQKEYKVIWNLCFRGQGDMPFWLTDSSGQYDTDEKRGKLISELINNQCEIVKKHIKEPIFCTNLYGEIMELYDEGYISLSDDIIKVRADNGFGRMVSRRQGNSNLRVSSMPDPEDKGAQGIYYHVSFYDLQAANHITMLPNSISFIDKELTEVLANGGDDFWVINCSNVRPHVYYLDAVRKKWFGHSITDEIQSREFAEDYFQGNLSIAKCYEAYPHAMIPYGKHEDEHMGEQYYAENIRTIINQFFIDKERGAKGLYWIAGEESLPEQTKVICGKCGQGIHKLEKLYRQCKDVSEKLSGREKDLFDAAILLQAQIHFFCAKGVVLFGDAYEAYEEENYKKAFVLFGESKECFSKTDLKLREAEYGIWQDFYLNDCLADVKHTAYMIGKIMGVMRELGDDAVHAKWYHEYCFSKEDRRVLLIMVMDNHLTDDELFRAMREKVINEEK